MKVFKSKDDIAQPLKKAVKKPIPVQCCQIQEDFQIHTLEGVLKGKKGDWLMVGIEGEIYACDNEIFIKTYEIISD